MARSSVSPDPVFPPALIAAPAAPNEQTVTGATVWQTLNLPVQEQ